MQKTPLQITASQQGTVANFRIIGYIGWETAAEQFRRQADEMVAAGCTLAHLYISSQGGDCFQADEMINILETSFTSFTGEGGALIASAASYMAIRCKTFEIPENGKMMIHKPKGGTYGTASEIAGYLKSLQDFEDQYYQDYLAKATDKKDFKEKWNAGDYWLMGKEAKAAGFATKVRKKVTIDKETKAMIEACAKDMPVVFETLESKKTKIETDMEHLKSIAKVVGLKEEATVEAVEASIKTVLGTNETLKAEKIALEGKLKVYEDAEKAKLTKEATELVAAAQKDGRTDDKGAPGWLAFFNTDHEAAKAALASVPTPESIVERINAAGGEKKGTAWEERQKEIDAANK
jgi:ATP-dependent protease ClpP protease subunit